MQIPKTERWQISYQVSFFSAGVLLDVAWVFRNDVHVRTADDSPRMTHREVLSYEVGGMRGVTLCNRCNYSAAQQDKECCG